VKSSNDRQVKPSQTKSNQIKPNQTKKLDSASCLMPSVNRPCGSSWLTGKVPIANRPAWNLTVLSPEWFARMGPANHCGSACEFSKYRLSLRLHDLEFNWHWLLDLRKTAAIAGVHDRRRVDNHRVLPGRQRLVDVAPLHRVDGPCLLSGEEGLLTRSCENGDDLVAVAPARSAGFQTCCIADFQVGNALRITQFAGLETRDTEDLEACATVAVTRCAPVRGGVAVWYCQRVRIVIKGHRKLKPDMNSFPHGLNTVLSLAVLALLAGGIWFHRIRETT
jgi:hypothetical protein